MGGAEDGVTASTGGLSTTTQVAAETGRTRSDWRSASLISRRLACCGPRAGCRQAGANDNAAVKIASLVVRSNREKGETCI